MLLLKRNWANQRSDFWGKMSYLAWLASRVMQVDNIGGFTVVCVGFEIGFEKL